MQNSNTSLEDNGFTHVEFIDEFPNATALTGLVLCNRWKINRLLHEGKQESGGNFGVGYIALDLNSNKECFLKVVDFRTRLSNIDQLSALLNMAKFEIQMHIYCGERKMSKVVQMLEHGQIVFQRRTDGEKYNLICLVLERGEGDIKSHISYAPNQSAYWKLSVLRDVALAIIQLERANLAHNDVKPSNVIRFESKGDQHVLKLGDVGRAVRKDGSGPFDSLEWAGDPRHQPIEVFYGWKELDWQNRRTAADTYMLGSLMCYLFVGASLTERVTNSLPAEYRHNMYKGEYRQILDVLRHTWASVIHDQIAPSFPASLRSELTLILQWLSDPDPRQRGEPNARRAGLLGLDRIQSRFVRLTQAALLGERTGKI